MFLVDFPWCIVCDDIRSADPTWLDVRGQQSELGYTTRMKISVHDNYLVSYEVRCERREIRLHTEFRDRGEPFEYTDVVFTGVCAYHFHQDCFTNIIFDIDETAPETIYSDHRAEFEAGRMYGWPGDWGKTEDAALAYFREHGVQGYALQSSYGMDGWILAKSMEIISRDGHVA